MYPKQKNSATYRRSEHREGDEESAARYSAVRPGAFGEESDHYLGQINRVVGHVVQNSWPAVGVRTGCVRDDLHGVTNVGGKMEFGIFKQR